MSRELTDKRIERADQYDQRTRYQAEWYCNRANVNKKFFQAIGIVIIFLGALVGFLPLFDDASGKRDILIGICGGLIVILKGVERIWLPEEKWVNYRKASEALLREREKYTEGIAPYQFGRDEDRVYTLFVERSILIKAEEQNNFWGLNDKNEKIEQKPDPQT